MNPPPLFPLDFDKTSLFPTIAALAISNMKSSSQAVSSADVFYSKLQTMSVSILYRDIIQNSLYIVPASYFSLKPECGGVWENQFAH
ncbi:hypothetical protein llap_4082 [Limosa lapponica baueri]|uniref:Uncharacterized protein n=1 Tax=Limosa lapponica baueri TaxID=1758121 RepID=A0A2I0UHR4_LIMLA|nr:hypothetical protein llap_4082 [Limosa lapponica baueri]